MVYYLNEQNVKSIQPGAVISYGSIEGTDSYCIFGMLYKNPGYPQRADLFLIPNHNLPKSVNASELYPLTDNEVPEEFSVHDGRSLEVSKEDAIEWEEFRDDEAKRFFINEALKYMVN